ncbi:alanine--tRNA ligase, cytoplasmic-like [Mercenaria mercenaria]|uniref:alanine--tRNA ligase, cytoplasmic-like n=1 Tax=Mercenaria mercenaria TaxID=6596 RepID=UPI00234EB75F|nr:alanine--tRNA ligase, cytoplasmic-like [Mercenaria mercenaria]XP_045200983.2 alanine--tRNA ligase, cytoplasmic-like [Mercenaria mercenaria]
MQALNHGICQKCFHKLSRLKRTSVRVHRRLYSSEWKSKDVRKQFLDFFCTKNSHEFVKSSSVIPGKNQGTYFTNAGMNQFKPIFLGTVPEGSDLARYRRVANSQKCVRVGGKHNDLDDVGRDLTHHTFFEMLGSWSFDDYFKKEACSMALTLLVDVYKLPLDRLYFTYFGGCAELGVQADLECREIWRELGVPEARILPFGMQDNFWDMGETGPCGPCTEIHFDHIGNRDASSLVNRDSPEVVEIWNLVFMQYNRLGPEKLVSLPHTHVDTGMGLERICAVLRGTMSNYDTDLFLPIFDVINKETGISVYKDRIGSSDVDNIDTAYRIIGDHARMATVCISDGLLPGRMDLEHRLRIVIYRALFQCHQLLKAKPGLLGTLVRPIAESLGDTYPDISTHENKVKEVLDMTEERYLQSHSEGRKNFEKLKKKNPDLTTLNGEYIKRLHDGYYGYKMSTELIEMIAPQYGLNIDIEDLHAYLEFQHGVPITPVEVQYPNFTAELLNNLASRDIPATDDSLKYEYTKSTEGIYEFPVIEGKIQCLVDDRNQLSKHASEGDKVGMILDKTQFYAEKGGQVGDKGLLKTQTGTVEVFDTQSSGDFVLHIGHVVQGHVEAGQEAALNINSEWRIGCTRNHTATHLVNSALRQVLGSDVTQSGSVVTCNKLTFDFSCWAQIKDEDIEKVDELVTSTIEEEVPVQRQLVPLKQALEIEGMVYLDNAVYPSHVYAVSVEGHSGNKSCISNELCGGTHVLNTGDIEDFCITSVQGQGSGTKSIVCLTAEPARQAKQTAEQVELLYRDLATSVKQDGELKHSTELQKQINTVLGTKVLPKLFKDKMMTKMAAIGMDINTALNKQAFRQLHEDLSARMSNEEDYIVHQFSMKVLPKLNKMMKSLKILKPLILVVETSNNTVAYIAFPKGREEERSEMVKMFCEAVFGRVTQSEDNYKVVSLKGKHTQIFLDWSYKLMESRKKDVVKS